MLLRVFLIITMLFIVRGQEFFPKNCSSYNVKTVQNYTLLAYLGTWFEIERYENVFQRGGDCVQANYSVKNNTHIKVLNSQKNLQTNTVSSIEGTATEANSTAADGKLIVTFGNITSISSNYWIVDTDYKSFAVVWSCSDILSNSSFQFLWLLSRNRNFTAEAQQSVNKTIEHYGFAPNKLRVTNQNPARCN